MLARDSVPLARLAPTPPAFFSGDSAEPCHIIVIGFWQAAAGTRVDQKNDTPEPRWQAAIAPRNPRKIHRYTQAIAIISAERSITTSKFNAIQ
jgi:hypothetical protein